MSSQLLHIGKTGLYSTKKSMQVAGHNVSNANTEGYTRQRSVQTTSPSVSYGNINLGNGSQIIGVNRVHDQFVEKKLNNSLTEFHYHEEKERLLTEVEDIFNEISSQGLSRTMANFFNSFRALSNDPENETLRSIVRESGKQLVQEFKRVATLLDETTQNINRKLDQNIFDINATLENISNLNVKISQMEAGHGEAGDLQDDRDRFLRTLSKFFKIQTYSDEKGRLIVNAPGIGTLISGSEYQELGTSVVNRKDANFNSSFDKDIFLKSSHNTPIGGRFKSGEISALLETRNEEVLSIRGKLDSLAFNMANMVNAIHRKGFINKPLPLDSTHNLKESYSGIDFFKIPDNKINAAQIIDISDEVKNDLANIVTGLEPNGPGDNRISLAISKIQHAKILDGGRTTLEEEYLKTVSNLGLVAGKNKINKEQAEGILAQSKAIKEQISGVSLDEETANLMKLQQTFNASARVMRVADEMLQSILDIKR